ncbi:MAG: helix-turn-helix domain-containing protein [Eubacteriales bacterium]
MRAKDLLLSGQYTISDAAREVGFSDPNYFARIFRSKEGISPSEFMK